MIFNGKKTAKGAAVIVLALVMSMSALTGCGALKKTQTNSVTQTQKENKKDDKTPVETAAPTENMSSETNDGKTESTEEVKKENTDAKKKQSKRKLQKRRAITKSPFHRANSPHPKKQASKFI